MPGLVGFISNDGPSASRRVLERQRDSLTRAPAHRQDDLTQIGTLWATRVHLDLLQREARPARARDLSGWMDGEIHNRREVAARLGIDTTSDLELLAALVRRDPTYGLLRELDGFFAAVLYDTTRNRLLLIGDRHGLRHLYWTRTRDGLAWSSETKAFLELPGFIRVIDRVAMHQFLDLGYMLADRTWFEGVHRLDSGTVLEFDLNDRSILQHRYWWWDRIEQRSETSITDDLVDELHDQFAAAVARRCEGDTRVGLTLSGGLDSRAILASLPKTSDPVEAITFGIRSSDEVRYATRAASVRGANHHVVALDASNWLHERIEGVWCTDGQLDLLHMHGIESRALMQRCFDVNMSGYLGDVVAGGSFLGSATGDADADRKAFVARAMGCDVDRLEGYAACAAHPSTDIYFLQNRGRRFIAEGTHHVLDAVEVRKPFLDARLIDFLYGLPDRLRAGGELYHRMLLRHYPDYFLTLPNASDGLPLGAGPFVRRSRAIHRRVNGRIKRGLSVVAPALGAGRASTNYTAWLRQGPGRNLLLDTLGSDQAICRDLLPDQDLSLLVHDFLRRRRFSPRLARFMTLEVWLQQVFHGRQRGVDLADRMTPRPTEIAA